MNLHLYIPAHSAHPPGLLKSLVFGQLERFWKQNSDRADFEKIAKEFYEHLINRGYDEEVLNPHFHRAAEKLDIKDNKTRNANTINNNAMGDNNIFFHVKYHPFQIPKETIRECFDNNCAAILKKAKHEDGLYPLNASKLTIAYSRANNLRDKLCKTKLPEHPNQNVSDILQHISERDPAS